MTKEIFLGALKAKVPVYHTSCGEVAFYYKTVLKSGDRLLTKNVVLVDGSQPESRSEMLCGSCGHTMWPFQLIVGSPYNVAKDIDLDDE